MADDIAHPISRRRLLEGAACTGAMLGGVGVPSPAASASASASASSGAGGAFPLIAAGRPAAVLVDADADPAVHHAATSLVSDLERVSGRAPARIDRASRSAGPVVIIGVLGDGGPADALIAGGRIDVADIAGEWEAFRQIVVDRPFPGVPQALVIVGSDRRGAVFGTYDLSERLGVSPWHWFADVAVARRTDVRVPAGARRDQPRVRYRGFFINDEDPCFSGWAKNRFGGVNAAVYARVFELLLRMKGNYLWPAMWGKAFAVDDPRSQALAESMGVVMGSSHHEPMMRAQDEWHRDGAGGVTGGAWNFETNAANLARFWRGGIARMMAGGGRGYESVVTVGMRGDGDEAMAEGTATALLERVVAEQRAIIADVTQRPAAETPQVWALYKEVQDYYDHGMRVPDDVTLLFSDDNWGQIRRLPPPGAPVRAGGYGVYYHFDYVGGPRNYKWLNTNQIEKVWQQMDLAYARGARAMWIVNVGDIKPMEYPLSFFMAMAWNPEAITPAALADYPRRWAASQFGEALAGSVGAMTTRYAQLAARRKPELIDRNSFALGGVGAEVLDGGEFGAIVAEWDALEAEMLRTRAAVSPDRRDAYYQLVEYPVAAMANLYRLHYASAWNRLLSDRQDRRANMFADRAEAAFACDAALTARYHAIGNGRWNGMMAQIHIGYQSWNEPSRQTMPAVVRVPEPAAAGPARIRFAGASHAQPQVGIVSVRAADFDRAAGGPHFNWTAIPSLGRTGSAVLALPQGRASTGEADAVRLEYDLDVAQAGPATLTLYLLPTLDTGGAHGVRVGVSLGDAAVVTLTADLAVTGGAADTAAKRRWTAAVCDNVVRLTAELGHIDAGRHVVKIWRIDDNMVLEKFVLATVPVAASYLGP